MSRRVAWLLGIQALIVAYLVLVPPSQPTEHPTNDDSAPSDPVASLDGAPVLSGATQVAPPEGTDEETGTKHSTVLLLGTITETNGSVIPDAVCGVIGPTGTVYQTSVRKDTGHFARAGIPPGVYRFRALANGFKVHDQMVHLPTGVRQFEHNVQLERLHSVPVRFLTPDGKPLLAAVPEAQEWLARCLSVSATTGEPPTRLRMTTDAAHHTFDRGQFARGSAERDPTRRDGRDGTLHIRGDFPVYAGLYLRQERLASRRLERAIDRLDFEIEPAQIRALLSGITFRLTCDGDRAQLDDVFVLLHDSTSGDPAEDTVRKNDEVYFVENHPPGTLHLQIHAGEGLAPFFRNVELRAGQTTDLGTIHLGPIRRQRFRIVDAEGNPVVGATVWPYELDLGWMAFAGMPIHFTSNASGVVRTALAGKRYALRIIEPGRGCFVAEIDLSEDQPKVVPLRLPTFVPLAIRTGDVALPVNVRILDATGHVVVARKFREPSVLPLGLAEGTYEMIVTRRDGEEQTSELQVKAPMSDMVVIE